MAADKTHLRNLDKSYKLKKTDKKTSEGKDVFINTVTGEEHSELSVTLEYPANSGKWINVPSLLDGRVYNAKGVLAMLKKGKLVPTSTHMSEQEAVESAQFRSNNLNNDFASTFPTEAENPEGLFVRTAQSNNVNSLNNNTLMAEGSPNSRGIDYSREPISPFQNMVDLSNIENLTDNGAPGSEFDVNKRMGAAMNSYGERIGEDAYRENLMNDAMQSYGERTGMSTGAAAAVERKRKASLEELASIMDRADAEKDDDYFDASKRFTNRWGDNALAYSDRSGSKPRQNDPKFSNMTTSAADQAMFDAAYKQRNFPDAGPKTRQSNKPGVNAKNLNPDEQMQNSYNSVPDMMANGPSTRQSNKPMFDFKYKPHMNPEQKANDNRNIKGLTPDYGKMPGFKLPTNDKGETTGNYWSADENSDFWKTDAGYQKAQETWGQNLPTFVKKPQRKDIDIDAIKKFFTSSR